MPVQGRFPAQWTDPVWCPGCGRLLSTSREDSEQFYAYDPDSHGRECPEAETLRKAQQREEPAEE